MARLKIESGLWYRHAVREMLERGCRACDEDFRFLESKGFLASTFFVFGNPDRLRRVKEALDWLGAERG